MEKMIVSEIRWIITLSGWVLFFVLHIYIYIYTYIYILCSKPYTLLWQLVTLVQIMPVSMFLYWIVLHKLHNWCNLCRTTQNKNMKTCIICIGVVWLVSPPAIGLCYLLMKQFVSLLPGTIHYHTSYVLYVRN